MDDASAMSADFESSTAAEIRLTRSFVPAPVLASTKGAITVLALVFLVRRPSGRLAAFRGRGRGSGGHRGDCGGRHLVRVAVEARIETSV